MILDEIVLNKRLELEHLQELKVVREKPILNPLEYLKKKPIIAEVKKASPALGAINTSVDPIEQALSYEKYGAGAISVLTDKKYFQGDVSFLMDISKAVKVPVLCKDFIISKLQIKNAYNAGADFILLIAEILTEEEISDLANYARSLGLYILFEVYKQESISKIEPLKPLLAGVNNRNLYNMKIDLAEGANKLILLPKGSFKISESGINSKEDIQFLRSKGSDGFLIGSSLMLSDDLQETFKQLYSAI